MLMRLVVLLTATVIAFAAPVRAWCEATCLSPAHDAGAAKPHCPTSEPTGHHEKISAGDLDDCPIVEAARPTTFAKLDFALAPIVVTAHRKAPETHRSRTPWHRSSQAPWHPSFIPLRI